MNQPRPKLRGRVSASPRSLHTRHGGIIALLGSGADGPGLAPRDIRTPALPSTPESVAQVAGGGASLASAGPVPPPAVSLLPAGTSAASLSPHGEAVFFHAPSAATAIACAEPDTHQLSMRDEEIVIRARAGALPHEIAHALGHDLTDVMRALNRAWLLGISTERAK